MWLPWFCKAVFWHTISAVHLDLSNCWYCASYHLSSSMEWGYHLYSILHQCSHCPLRGRQFCKVCKISRIPKIPIDDTIDITDATSKQLIHFQILQILC